ncbi:MAG: phospholipid-binding protein [Elainella sp. Prado103]|jgi:osmotically-inducible protein OsmY|nr:phospholipid-binding protein [Elainella sp. Prado103]
MGWLSRLFPGSKKPEASASTPAAPAPADASVPAAKVGLNGEFDESGLAKRVALAFDEDPDLDDIDTLWVAQLSSKVVLKGKVPTQAALDKMVSVAMGVNGATEVDTSAVTVG